MVNALFGQKTSQSQRFLTDGTRIPVTLVSLMGNSVVGIKTQDKDGYSALQVRVGDREVREIRFSSQDDTLKTGDTVKTSDVFKEGDIVDVIGVSKGKGYAGVVKRHHFKGGPRTHGQSDRERAPGSIGQTTTPGRVYKGKRMAGRMGSSRVTVKNLRVVDVLPDLILIKGVVPGVKNSLIMIRKVGEDKKFVPMYKEETKETEVVETKTE